MTTRLFNTFDETYEEAERLNETAGVGFTYRSLLHGMFYVVGLYKLTNGSGQLVRFVEE